MQTIFNKPFKIVNLIPRTSSCTAIATLASISRLRSGSLIPI